MMSDFTLTRRAALAGLMMTGLSACALPVNQNSDPRPTIARSYRLRDLRFSAQPGLTESEANNFYPPVDIVWRGDAPGDRIAQIGTMFTEAGRRNQSILTGDVPVIMDVTLVRFHGVTERTRTTIGGIYNIIFDMTILDARTGEVIEPTRRVVGNLDAPGGAEGRRLIETGQTERVRVTDFLTSLIRSQLI